MRPLACPLVILLAACAAVPERPAVENPQAVWESRRAALAQLDTWELHARVALRVPEEGVQGTVHWRVGPDGQQVDLTGPFGSGRVRIVANESGAELHDANNATYRDVSVEELLARVTGWRLPLDGLRYWVVGIPVPDTDARVELDEWGRLRSLKQRGWTVRFLDYVRAGEYELPRRVFIERDTNDVRNFAEARFVVDRWQVGALAGSAS